MYLLRKWKRCESWSASSQTQGELDLHCFKDKVYWGRSCEICYGILLQFIFAYVKTSLKFIFLVYNIATIYICCLKYCNNLSSMLLWKILLQFIFVRVKMLKQLIFVKEKILLKFIFVSVKIMQQFIISIVKILLQFKFVYVKIMKQIIIAIVKILLQFFIQ